MTIHTEASVRLCLRGSTRPPRAGFASFNVAFEHPLCNIHVMSRSNIQAIWSLTSTPTMQLNRIGITLNVSGDTNYRLVLVGSIRDLRAYASINESSARRCDCLIQLSGEARRRQYTQRRWRGIDAMIQHKNAVKFVFLHRA